MSIFDLILNISPAFHRQCSIRIERQETGVASFEAQAAGLLPAIALTLPVDETKMALLHARCSSMLTGWDKRWSQAGLDGISIDGIFASLDSKPQAFSLWSSRQGSLAHEMLAAALDCFPFERCNGAAGELLEIVRSYFNLQPPATVVNRTPLTLRLAPWVHAKDANEIKSIIRLLPTEGDLVIDASGIERFGWALTRILPVEQLLKRNNEVRWIVRNDIAEVLIKAGVEQSKLTIIPHLPISHKGEPIVLGGIFISSSDLISLARASNKIELIRTFRKEYPLTLEQAAKAASELIEIIAL